MLLLTIQRAVRARNLCKKTTRPAATAVIFVRVLNYVTSIISFQAMALGLGITFKFARKFPAILNKQQRKSVLILIEFCAEGETATLRMASEEGAQHEQK